MEADFFTYRNGQRIDDYFFLRYPSNATLLCTSSRTLFFFPSSILSHDVLRLRFCLRNINELEVANRPQKTYHCFLKTYRSVEMPKIPELPGTLVTQHEQQQWLKHLVARICNMDKPRCVVCRQLY